MTDKLSITVTRHFDASPERVFDAWLDPETAGQWLFATPTGQMVKVEIDARVGGRFIIVEGPDCDGCAREIVSRPDATIDGDGATRWTFGDLEQFVRRFRRVDIHLRTRRGQQFGLPRRCRTSTGEDGAFAVERQKNGKTSQ